jgi:predicted dehydrogenase
MRSPVTTRSAESTPVRVGLIGAGGVTEHYHLPVLRRLRNVELPWVVDRDREAAERLASGTRIPHVGTSLDACADVDAALVAVPVGARLDVVPAVLARGWSALCEKPFAASVADHRTLLGLADDRVHIATGYLRRFYGSTRVVRELVASRVFGAVREVLAGSGTPVRRTGQGAGFYQASAADAGGGVLAETGSHLVDQLVTILDVEDFTLDHVAQRFAGDLEVETSVRGELATSPERVALSMVVSRINDCANGILIRCERGEIELGLMPDAPTWLRSSDGRRLARLDTHEEGATTVAEALELEWRDFLDARAHGGGSTAQSTGLLTTAFVEACYRAGRAASSLR